MLATMRGATGACERAAARCRRKPVQPPAPMAPGASGTGRFADGEKRLRDFLPEIKKRPQAAKKRE